MTLGRKSKQIGCDRDKLELHTTHMASRTYSLSDKCTGQMFRILKLMFYILVKYGFFKKIHTFSRFPLSRYFMTTGSIFMLQAPPESLRIDCFMPGNDLRWWVMHHVGGGRSSEEHRPHGKSSKMTKNQWKSMKINENQWKSIKINENSWFLMIL